MPGGEWVLSRMGIQYEGGRMDRCRAPDGWSTTTTTTTTVVTSERLVRAYVRVTV